MVNLLRKSRPRLWDERPTKDGRDLRNYVGVDTDVTVHRSPEKDLCAAVLEDAIHWAVVRQEEREWILTTDGAGYLFSFSSVCMVLGLDPEAVRARLQAQWRPLVPRHHRSLGRPVGS